MEPQPDFRELLALFNAHHVEYLIVGGYALAFHGAPRFTGDLGIFVKPDAANAQREDARWLTLVFAGLRQRVWLKSPVRANRTPGSVWGRSGNRPSYRDGLSTKTAGSLSIWEGIAQAECAAGYCATRRESLISSEE